VNENLLRYNKKATFCCFDFEAENLNLFTSRPWQFACVIGTVGGVTEKHDIFIKWPDLNVSKTAAEVTRFDASKVEREGIKPKEAFKIINDIFGRVDYLCGHNVLGYDLPVYVSACRALKIDPLDIHENMLDTLPLMKGLPDRLDVPFKQGEDILEYQMKLLHKIVRKRGYATLGALANMFEVPYDKDKAHDALYDVEVNFAAILKLLWKIEI